MGKHLDHQLIQGLFLLNRLHDAHLSQYDRLYTSQNTIKFYEQNIARGKHAFIQSNYIIYKQIYSLFTNSQ
jgi:hypothetical protein